jgi:predicted metal-binding protein
VPEPETVLYVCTTCRAAEDAPDRPRAGARLLEALRSGIADRPDAALRVEGVECLSVCKRPCTVAVASPGRWTYVYGDLDAESSARTILDGLARYGQTPDGLVPWRERPEAFRKGVVARIPPFPAPPFPAPAAE